MLGHELRNPLGALSNALYVLNKSEPRTAAWRQAQDIIGRQSAHLNALVDDLLDVGRAITGKISLDLRALDLDTAVQAAIKSLQTAGHTQKHRLDNHGTPVWVRADKTRGTACDAYSKWRVMP